MTVTFTPEREARLAAIEAAPDAPESWAATVERMARAMAEEATGRSPGPWAWSQEGDRYRRLAAAAFRAEHEGGAV